MTAGERFLNYVKINTASNMEAADRQPSTPGQLELAGVLAKEMRAIGLEGVKADEKGYVYGFIPASPGCEKAPALGLIAHMDTSPDASGQNVQPVLHPNYNGGDLKLPNGFIIKVKNFPALAGLRGQSLVTAGGDTLLGADDKAGIAEILTACERVLREGLPHGRLCVAFTPDEEVGRGADCFDVGGFGAQFAYTVDGGAAGEVEYETFNAASAKLRFTGVAVHPGQAKGIMVNALRLAAEYDALLPAAERPEHTEGREGFYHLTGLCGTAAKAESGYIVRDHSRPAFEARKEAMRTAAAELERRYYPGCAELCLKDSYYNMGEVVEKHFHLVENAKAAVRAAGLVPRVKAVRGGTDGSRLSFMGLPCPNLGTGGHYGHGPAECITLEAMEKSVEILLRIISTYAGYTGSGAL